MTAYVGKQERMKTETPRRLEVANRCLATFQDARIVLASDGRTCVEWQSRSGVVRKLWKCRGGQEFYPVWSHLYPGGGTSMRAMAQLIYWIRNRPIFPLRVWQHFASEKVKLLPSSSVEMLREGGYPEEVPCVLCGVALRSDFDWGAWQRVGPCCSTHTGCRQKEPGSTD